MRPITLLQPERLIFGNGCINQFVTEMISGKQSQLFIIISPHVSALCMPAIEEIRAGGITVTLNNQIEAEPTVEVFLSILQDAKKFNPDCVVGIGGGSILDTAKLIAAFLHSEQSIYDAFGIGKLPGRSVGLICLPTTSGTGSEVSPNAILLDSNDNLKKGVISPYLVPDAAYIDPELTVTIPPNITAGTGIDALTHCIEAYANLNAHPVIDMYALEGIKLISASITRAVDNGSDLEARADLSLGSLYGGKCLGPVNTAAVHALSYPLGGRYHIAHGLSNALLLPHVMEFNIVEMPGRYANIARALGVHDDLPDFELAMKGVERIKQLLDACGISMRLSEFNIPRDAFEEMAESALTVKRFLKNNPRTLTKNDVLAIYEKIY